MRKYYLFLIKEHYLHEPEYLIYKIMDNLYHLTNSNLDYGISCYNQLCDNFNVPILAHYLINKFEGNIATCSNNKYIIKQKGERCIVKLSLKFVIIVTNKNIPFILKCLKYYNHKIFVCDFDNNDYFWLHKCLSVNKTMI